MSDLSEFLQAELARRAWRPADLARAAGVPDATVSHVLKGSRRAGPEVCRALARALDEPPERIFRLAGLLPGLSPAVEEEREAVDILRSLSPELRGAAMRMLRGLKPPPAPGPEPGRPAEQAGAPAAPERAAPDPYLEVLEQLWDKAPDWKKKDMAAQIRAAVEEYQREQDQRVAGGAPRGGGQAPRSGGRASRSGDQVPRSGEGEEELDGPPPFP
jgi:transcriptional regulator with XRE-family HTH domain